MKREKPPERPAAGGKTPYQKPFCGRRRVRWAILKNYEAAKGQCLALLARRKKQAIPKLAATIRDSHLPEHVRHHAAEALGYVVNRRLHWEVDPAGAALHWLQRHGR